MATTEFTAEGDDVLALSADLPTMTFEAGQILVDQDVRAPAIYVLVEGGMVIERDGAAFATVDHAGAVFGEMSCVLKQVATASVRASRPSLVRVASDPAAFLARPGVALAVLRLTSSRLAAMTTYLTDVRAQYAHLDNHLGMLDQVLATLLHHQAPAARPGSARDPDG